MKTSVLLLCLFALSATVSAQDPEPTGWIYYVDMVFQYSDLVRGFLMGFFDDVGELQTAACFANVDNLKSMFDGIYNLTIIRPVEFGMVLRTAYDALAFTVLTVDHCEGLVTSFENVFVEYKDLFTDMGTYWSILFEDIVYTAFNMAGDFGYIKNCWQKGRFIDVGEKLGEMLFDTFLKGMKEKLPIPEPQS